MPPWLCWFKTLQSGVFGWPQWPWHLLPWKHYHDGLQQTWHVQLFTNVVQGYSDPISSQWQSRNCLTRNPFIFRHYKSYHTHRQKLSTSTDISRVSPFACSMYIGQVSHEMQEMRTLSHNGPSAEVLSMALLGIHAAVHWSNSCIISNTIQQWQT